MISEGRKIKENNGDNSIGEIIPLFLDKVGFKNIDCFINDRIIKLKPPYESKEEIEKINMLSKLIENYPFNFSTIEKAQIRKVLAAISDNKFVSYNPTMLFLSIGEKIIY